MTETSFTIAAFDPSGLLVGTSSREHSDLSEKWVAIASAYLAKNGESFKADWDGPLAHLKTQFTSSDGVALVSFCSYGISVASLALLCGANSDTELSVLKMFVNSLRKVEVVKESAANKEPFGGVFQLTARPLMIVVPWGDARVSAQDDELVQELALHLSAAFFQNYQLTGSA